VKQLAEVKKVVMYYPDQLEEIPDQWTDNYHRPEDSAKLPEDCKSDELDFHHLKVDSARFQPEDHRERLDVWGIPDQSKDKLERRAEYCPDDFQNLPRM